MSKPTAGRKVGVIKNDATGIEAPYYLKNGTTFWCEVLAQTFEAPDAHSLQRKVQEYIKDWLKLTWFPLIDVELRDRTWGSSSDGTEGVVLKLHRKYFAQGTGSALYLVDWDVPEEHRKAKMSLSRENTYKGIEVCGMPLGAPFKLGQDHFLIDYTPAVWDRLCELREGIKRLREAIRGIVSNQEKLMQLVNSPMSPLAQLRE